MRKMITVIDAIGAFGAVSFLIYKFIGINAANNSLLYIILLVGSYSVIKCQLFDSDSLIGNKLLWRVAFVFTVVFVTGIYFDNNLSFEKMTTQDRISFSLCTIMLTPLFKCLFTVIYTFLEKWAGSEKNKIISDKKVIVIFLTSFAIIFACWIPVWLSYYPGLWNYDVRRQLWEFMGVKEDYPLSKHHPLIHTLFLGGCYSVGLKGGNYNSGVVLYAILQMVIMAGIFAYTYVYIYQHITSKMFKGGGINFFCNFPNEFYNGDKFN